MSNGGIPGRLVEFIRSRVFGTRSLKQLNHQTNNMKKYILIAAAAIVTTLGVGYAASSIHNVADHSKCENGTARCNSCNGTGWQTNGQNKCYSCRGTGTNSAY